MRGFCALGASRFAKTLEEKNNQKTSQRHLTRKPRPMHAGAETVGPPGKERAERATCASPPQGGVSRSEREGAAGDGAAVGEGGKAQPRRSLASASRAGKRARKVQRARQAALAGPYQIELFHGPHMDRKKARAKPSSSVCADCDRGAHHNGHCDRHAFETPSRRARERDRR